MKTLSSSQLLSILAFTALFGSIADAAVGVSNTITAPSENIFAYNEPGGPYGGENATTAYYTGLPRSGGNPQYRQVGTALTLGAEQSGDLTSVTWKIYPSPPQGIWGKAFSINIYKTQGQGDAPSAQTLIASQQGVLPSLTLEQDSYLTFTLDAPVALTGGSTYVIAFAFDEPTSANTGVVSLTFRTTGNSVPNSDWQRWLYQGGFADPSSDGWNTSTDLPAGSGAGNRNQPIIYLGGTVIPEPSTYALAAVGVTGLLGMRLFRNRR